MIDDLTAYHMGVQDERKKWEEKIEQMIAEIEKLPKSKMTIFEKYLKEDILEVIHKYTKEQTDGT